MKWRCLIQKRLADQAYVEKSFRPPKVIRFLPFTSLEAMRFGLGRENEGRYL